jgi:hypothetical protein
MPCVVDALNQHGAIPSSWTLQGCRVSRLWPHKRGRFTIEYKLDLVIGGDHRTVRLQGRWSDADAAREARALKRVVPQPRINGPWLLGVGFFSHALSLALHSPDCDRRLPWLDDALHPPLLATRLAGTHTEQHVGLDGGLEAAACEVVSYRAARRCTMRFCGQHVVYGKSFHDDRGIGLAKLYESLGAYLRASPGTTIGIPRPVDYVPNMHMLVLEECHSGGAPAPSVHDADAGRALAHLHAVPLAIDTRHAPEAEIDILRRWLSAFEQLEQPDVEPLRRGIAELERLTPPGTGDRPPALLHRDFHPGQLIGGPHNPALVDLDTLSLGDAETDVGTWLSHVLLALLPQAEAGPRFANLADTFIAGYENGGGRIKARRLRYYLASALLRRGAIQLLRQPRVEVSDRLWRAAGAVLGCRTKDVGEVIDAVAQSV